ncbi:uncharacterized protein LOC115769222 [Drosophila novamexicana]|uniref:uncharacterized protein LOC115769222 n=1 Tax=Drosophila novamexicana TaxID=47314 RepID=UPI0011E59740|nr:uncharacterized protein LOC115769222 [Drosophila novamexicana]
MWKIVFLSFLSLYVQLATSVKDPHLCIKNVEVSYTVTERASLESYGEFANLLKMLNVPGEMRTIQKTKLEAREECCEGYERSTKADEGCQPVPTVLQDEPSSTVSVIDNNPIVPLAISNSSKLSYRCCKIELILICAIVHIFTRL